MPNELSTRIDQDRLNLLKRDRIAALTQAVLDPISSHPGEELLAASATLFAVMCERYSASPQDLHEYGRRVLGADEPFHKQGNDQLEALRDFAALRVRGERII